MNVTEFRNRFGEHLDRVVHQGERIPVDRRGTTVAYLVSAEDVALLQELEDLYDARAARDAQEEGGFVALDALAVKYGLKKEEEK